LHRAYFDDTGAAEQAVGGCVAPEECWENLDRAWGVAIAEAGITWFHARDFEDLGHPDYRHLTPADRSALFETLLRLIDQHIRLPSGAHICMILPELGVQVSKGYGERDYAAQRRSGKTEREAWLDRAVSLNHDPYSICLGQCLRCLLDECGIAPEEKVSVSLAHQERRKAKSRLLYEMAGGVPRWAPLLGGLSNGRHMEPRRIRPLQVADFVAYYLAKGRRTVGTRDDRRPERVAKTLRPVFVDYCQALSATDRWRP